MRDNGRAISKILIEAAVCQNRQAVCRAALIQTAYVAVITFRKIIWRL